MTSFLVLAQIIVAASVAFVWIFRIHNVIKEFNQFGLSDVTRSFVGFSKTALATLLIVGIWYDSLVMIPALLMGLFMVAAQYFHFKAGNPFQQRLPSLLLLLLCVFIVVTSAKLI
ncbi:MAG: DoxX family protein [Flavobacteriaceae bacterium]|nr:DoxX family protein [Flavobacteriaceae bacterium]